MYYMIYETTNLINGKKYRGAHSCKDLNDGYLGSGKLLKKAIEKYGVQNFERKILIMCDTLEDMYIQESVYVDVEWVNNSNTYNLKVGGEGGWDYIQNNGLVWNEERKKRHSEVMKQKRNDGRWGPKSATNGMKGKKHSSRSRVKIAINNQMTLSQNTIDNRIQQWDNLPDKRGKITEASKLWGISHTQVRRFIRKYYNNRV